MLFLQHIITCLESELIFNIVVVMTTWDMMVPEPSSQYETMTK